MARPRPRRPRRNDRARPRQPHRPAPRHRRPRRAPHRLLPQQHRPRARFPNPLQPPQRHLTTEPPIPAHHVSGRLGSAARQREIKAFLANTPSLITNARCLTEGVDVPLIDCVFFADPKGSTIEIVQAAGRALRLAPGKTRGYILVPVVVPEGATLDEVTATSAFKFVLVVLRRWPPTTNASSNGSAPPPKAAPPKSAA
ncbi:MAG: hypothetical protein H7343_01000 [Undibacterium sp.]|nr:hypothetical protein [Opitutaceae bacterium]